MQCSFCEEESITTYNDRHFCNDCWSLAKYCDECGIVGVYNSTVFYDKNEGKFICTSCSSNEDHVPCIKCGKSHKPDETGLCRTCKAKWFTCDCCGSLKTHARSKASSLDYLIWADYVTPSTCSSCVTTQTEGKAPRHIIACNRCGKFTGNESHCDACLSIKHSCTHCNDTFFESDPSKLDNQPICPRCASKHTFVCEGCNVRQLNHNKDSKHPTYDKTCAIGLKSCDRCDKVTTKITTVPDFNNIDLCPACVSSTIKTCTLCKEKKFDIEGGLCPDCRVELGHTTVRYYSTKLPVKLKGQVHQPHYGIENEVSIKEQLEVSIAANYFAKIPARDMILKSDSSVDHGFECVFKPFTFMEFSKYDFSKLFPSKIIKHSNTCGMHVHINKSAFKTTHLYKFINFFYKNQTFIEHVAERASTQYCRKNEEKITDLAKTKKNNSRAQLNLQGKQTIEVRIFQGVTDEAAFRKNVEFLDALYYFTLTNNLKDSADSTLFEQYVMKSSYKNLKAFLKGSN